MLAVNFWLLIRTDGKPPCEMGTAAAGEAQAAAVCGWLIPVADQVCELFERQVTAIFKVRVFMHETDAAIV